MIDVNVVRYKKYEITNEIHSKIYKYDGSTKARKH